MTLNKRRLHGVADGLMVTYNCMFIFFILTNSKEAEGARVLTKGCIRFLPIGYWYGFGVCMENAVNHRMKPDKRSRSESNVDAIIAREPLLMDA